MRFNHLKPLASVGLLIGGLTVAIAQQNRTLYLQHDVPQSSLLNPAVPLSCGWTIGLPVLSSVHLNMGDNFASFDQLFANSGNNVYTSTLYDAEKHFRPNNIVSSEFHVELLELGYHRNNWSIMVTAIEKANLLTNIPGDLFTLLLHGNGTFLGKRASFNRLSAFGSEYTELGLSVAKQTVTGLHWGVRGKLLFGKVNFSTAKSQIGLTTLSDTYDLGIDGNLDVRTSMPAWLQIADNRADGLVKDGSVGIGSLMTELGNPGLALDLGLIVPVSDQVELSLSMVDLGFIAWRQNIHNYTASGQFVYTGPFNDSIDTQSYITDLANAFTDSLNLTGNGSAYTTLLPTKLMVGINVSMTPKLNVGAMADVQAFRTKLLTGLNVEAAYEPINHCKAILSWSYQYNTAKNLGAGVILGRRPVQFYVLSDNVLAVINPMGARNANLRVGVNILLGCKANEEASGSKSSYGRGALEGTCGWERRQPQKKQH